MSDYLDSGLCMAELLVEGKSSTVDLTSFDPARYMVASKGRKRGRKMGRQEVGEQW